MQEKYFAWLDALRESGAVNMFGAAPYLMERFDLSKSEAKVVLLAWMKSFGKRQKEKVNGS